MKTKSWISSWDEMGEKLMQLGGGSLVAAGVAMCVTMGAALPFAIDVSIFGVCTFASGAAMILMGGSPTEAGGPAGSAPAPAFMSADTGGPGLRTMALAPGFTKASEREAERLPALRVPPPAPQPWEIDYYDETYR
jgi:hypothetical protein